MIPEGFERGLEKKVENQGMNRDHPDNSIIKISQNTEKSPGDFRER